MMIDNSNNLLHFSFKAKTDGYEKLVVDNRTPKELAEIIMNEKDLKNTPILIKKRLIKRRIQDITEDEGIEFARETIFECWKFANRNDNLNLLKNL